jgi:hypothetical protein
MTVEEKAREMIQKYQELKVGESTVSCPYYMHVVRADVMELLKEVSVSDKEIRKFSALWKRKMKGFGYLQGKGTPDEITSAALQITKRIGLSIEHAKPEIAVEMMKHLGLGIDCSGAVFNVLKYAFEAVGKLEKFMDSLDWREQNKRDASRAGVFIFAGKASRLVDTSDLRTLDLLLVKNQDDRYTHIAMLLGAKGGFEVVQSTVLAVPTGINVSRLSVVDKKPVFEFVPGLGKRWEEVYVEGGIEFRRLIVLDS